MCVCGWVRACCVRACVRAACVRACVCVCVFLYFDLYMETDRHTNVCVCAGGVGGGGVAI